jgi:hypothetical protein
LLCERDRFIDVEIWSKREMAVWINQSRYDGAAAEIPEPVRWASPSRSDPIDRDDPSIRDRQRRAVDRRGSQPIEE